MKFLIFFIFSVIFYSCSFDNKSGIWNNVNLNSDNEKTKNFKDFKILSSADKPFQKNILIDKDFKFKNSPKISTDNWIDEFYSKSNNFNNFKYLNNNQLLLKSKKITNHKINDHILYENGNIISSDSKGNVIVYSKDKNRF